jgi:hypothetical protein
LKSQNEIPAGGDVMPELPELPKPQAVATAIHWADLPDVLSPKHLRGILDVNGKNTFKRWCDLGILPQPCIKSGNVVRWRKEDVIACFERRAKYFR